MIQRSLYSIKNDTDATKEQLIALLKQELGEYLEKRRTNPLNEESSQQTKTVGGTRGNAVLDFISVTPAPEREFETKADVFDYDQLAKYGYGNLATLMMKAGGRLQFYEYFGLDTPVAAPVKDTYSADEDSSILLEPPKYAGLQLGLLQDDQAQAEALERARTNKSIVEEESSSQVLLTQRGKQSGSSVPKGDWTVERIDAWALQQKELQSWARKERERKVQADKLENFDSLGLGKLTSVVTAFTTAFAFGRATPALWESVLQRDMDELVAVKAIAATFLLASVGSSAYCGQVAPQLQRSRTLWMIKGLLGGPVAIQQLQSADRLQTAGEIAKDAAEAAARRQ